MKAPRALFVACALICAASDRDPLATLQLVGAARAAEPAPPPVSAPVPTAPSATSSAPMTAPVAGAALAVEPAPPPAPPPGAVPTPTIAPASARATPPPGAVESALPNDEQQVTVYLRGLPAGAHAYVQQADEAPVAMADPGLGVLVARLRGPPVRFLQLRLLHDGPGNARYALYDGLVVLGDRARETVAFQYQDGQALRLPVSPSARVEVALDQRVSWWVSLGWGVLALGWVGLLGVMWALRGR